MAVTTKTHTAWKTGNDVVANGDTAIVTDRLYTGSVEYYIGNGVTKYNDMPKTLLDAQCVGTTAPASASATGTKGMIVVASGYIYACVDTNTWQRAAISTWS